MKLAFAIVLGLLAVSSAQAKLITETMPASAGTPASEHESNYRCINDGHAVYPNPNHGRCKVVYRLATATGPGWKTIQSLRADYTSPDKSSSMSMRIYKTAPGDQPEEIGFKEDYAPSAQASESLTIKFNDAIYFMESGIYAVVELRGDTRLQSLMFQLDQFFEPES